MQTLYIKQVRDVILPAKDKRGDWIDLRSAEDIEYGANEFFLIPLGIAMKLPYQYEANIVPRSSTFKNFGIIQTNSYGVVDNSYNGNDDEWFFPAYSFRSGVIKKNDRICQFRINHVCEALDIMVVKNLNNNSRGGHGSSGIN